MLCGRFDAPVLMKKRVISLKFRFMGRLPSHSDDVNEMDYEDSLGQLLALLSPSFGLSFLQQSAHLRLPLIILYPTQPRDVKQKGPLTLEFTIDNYGERWYLESLNVQRSAQMASSRILYCA